MIKESVGYVTFTHSLYVRVKIFYERCYYDAIDEEN